MDGIWFEHCSDRIERSSGNECDCGVGAQGGAKHTYLPIYRSYSIPIRRNRGARWGTSTWW